VRRVLTLLLLACGPVDVDVADFPHGPPRVRCGDSEDTCAAGFFCEKTSCDAFADGFCTPIPQGMCDGGVPECGCDDKPYDNACERQKAQQSRGPSC